MLLNPDQEMIRDAVRDFAQQELWPNAARWDKEQTFPHEVHKGLAALGAYGICVPENLGGAGFGLPHLGVGVRRNCGRRWWHQHRHQCDQLSGECHSDALRQRCPAKEMAHRLWPKARCLVRFV